jgi:tetratricopeptide (TPR) repeat protein
MEMYLRTHGVRQFDFPKFAQPLRDEIRNNAERLAAEHGIEVQFIRHHEQRKETIVAKILEQRGDTPGLVAILSALEVCPGSAKVQINAGILERRAGNYSQALNHLRRALAIDPSYCDCHHWIGVTLVNMGMVEAGLQGGQMIARVGSTGLSTGPHLHFEVRLHDKPLDPRVYLTGSPIVHGSARAAPVR